MTAKLITREAGKEKTFQVTDAGLTLGRHADNQASLDDSRLSRFHARIKVKNGAWYAEDLGSTNGNFLNDNRFEGEVKLSPGDKLRFGATEAELIWDDGTVTKPEPPAPHKTEVLERPKDLPSPADLKTAATIVAPLSSLMKELPKTEAEAPAAPAPAPEKPGSAPLKHVVLSPAAAQGKLETVSTADGNVKPITPVSPEEIAALENLTPVEPAEGDKKPGTTIKPLIRKPVIGGGLKPGLKLPPRPGAGLKPGLKLPPKPAGFKPGIKLPPKTTIQLKPGLKLPPKPGAGGPAK